jgi:tRNA A37 threonylcarbamoyladenosine synthetase subunit TsaC/SUA5/YrdC
LEFLKITAPIATTSANLSGEPAALDIAQAKDYIGKEVDFILEDFGHTAQGTASTVILLDGDNIKILRQGTITPQ